MANKKIIISGLDNAGKTSILKAFNKRYDFEQEIKELQPTKKIEYHQTQFLNNSISFWDMGGQKRYRDEYNADPDFYFANTDLLLYIIDIQDNSKFNLALEYLNVILDYFNKNDINVPLIVAFHKSDPKLKDSEELIEKTQNLMTKIVNIEQLKKIFLSTSIYDVLSIVQLISETLSLFDVQYLKIHEFLEKNLIELGCDSIILFDQNGTIISENYSDTLDFNLNLKLMNSIKEHIIQLKKVQEENLEMEPQINQITDSHLSNLHQIIFKTHTFYISALIKTEIKPVFLKKLSKFQKGLFKVLKPVLSK